MMRRPLIRQRLLQGLLLQGLLLPALTLPASAEPNPQPAPRGTEAGAAPATGSTPATNSNNQPGNQLNKEPKRDAQGQGGQGESELSPKEKTVLQQIRSLKAPRWRRFGACRYDWSTWRNEKDGVRATNAECGEPARADRVAVHCATLKVSRQVGQEAWSKWRLPLSTEESSSTGGEDLMVAALCANALPVPVSAPEPKAEQKPGSQPQAGSQGKPGGQPTGKGQPDSKAKTGSTPGNKPAGSNTSPAPAKR